MYCPFQFFYTSENELIAMLFEIHLSITKVHLFCNDPFDFLPIQLRHPIAMSEIAFILQWSFDFLPI